MTKWRVDTVIVWVLLFVLTVLFVTPFYVLFRNAVISHMQIVSPDSGWLPWPMQIGSNVRDILTHRTVNIQSGLLNSAIIGVVQTALAVSIAMLAGYALARIPCRWKQVVFVLLLGTLMIPGQVIFIPTYIVASRLGLINTYTGLILPGIFSGFYAIMFRQFYLDFPREIEESGFLDGLGYFGVFFRLAVPNSKPIIIALSTLSFMTSWNAFLWPLVVGQDPSMWTAQVSISALISAQRIVLSRVFMAGLIVILPTVFVFLVLQKHLVRGVVFSGIKG